MRKQPQVCVFFSRPGGCRKGNYCRFIHDKNADVLRLLFVHPEENKREISDEPIDIERLKEVNMLFNEQLVSIPINLSRL